MTLLFNKRPSLRRAGCLVLSQLLSADTKSGIGGNSASHTGQRCQQNLCQAARVGAGNSEKTSLPTSLHFIYQLQSMKRTRAHLQMSIQHLPRQSVFLSVPPRRNMEWDASAVNVQRELPSAPFVFVGPHFH